MRWVRAGAAGLVVTAGIVALAGTLDRDAWAVRLLTWPLFAVQAAFPPPCGQGHTPGDQFCEGTAVQMAATAAGLALTVCWYAGIVWLIAGDRGGKHE